MRSRSLKANLHRRMAKGTLVVWPNVCTIQNRNMTVNGVNQPIDTSNTDVAGMVNLPCRLVYTMSSEKRDREIESKYRRANLRVLGYFPQITSRVMQAVVDGLQWHILGVEVDSLQFSTILTLETING